MPTILHLCRWDEPEGRDTGHQGGDSEADICFKAVHPTVPVLPLGMMGDFFQTENANADETNVKSRAVPGRCGIGSICLGVPEVP